MPVYEYKCTVCQERFEVEQSFSDPALTTLPAENGHDHEHQLKKVFSPVGISFRGGGFYRNEARSSSRSGSSSSESSSGSETTKAETKADSKASESPKAADKASTSTSGSSSD